MGFIKKLVGISKFNFNFAFDHCSENSNFDNFNQTLVLNPLPSSHQKLIPLIPKKIWIYWQGQDCLLVQKCVEKIRLLNPEFELHFLNQETIKQYSQIDYDYFPNISPQLKSDLIRLDLLTVHGGYWLDASILTYDHLGWIQTLINHNQTASFGYYRKKNTTIPEFPVIETWLLATPPKNNFFSAWRNELLNVIEKTPKYYIQELKKNLKNVEDYFQNIGMLEYLCAYVAAQRIMRDHPPSITLINCDKNAFFLQTQNRWNKYKVLDALAIQHKPEQMPKLIKLVGKERRLINTYYAKGKYKAHSLLAELNQ